MKHRWVKLGMYTLLGLGCLSLTFANAGGNSERQNHFRGFNLLEKFSQSQNTPYREEDFQMISDMGFNMVRLPIDYRCYTSRNHWTQFNEAQLKEIDQAVHWGQKYKVHVCLNLHRAPGYSVALPQERKSLWSDTEAQQVLALHWGMFAKRYRGISSKQLSFNLINEPPDMEEAEYYRGISQTVMAVKKNDPNRLIICDGINYGKKPVQIFIPLQLGQATRGYMPLSLTSYQAPWIDGAMAWPTPRWPLPPTFSQYLYGPSKRELCSPLMIKLNGSAPQELSVKVNQVSVRAKLVIKADENVIFEKEFIPGPGQGEWSTINYNPTWNSYRNTYNKEYQVKIPMGTRMISLENSEGDWMSLATIRFKFLKNEKSLLLVAESEWGKKQPELEISGSGDVAIHNSELILNRDDLWRLWFAPWKEIKQKGIFVVVGEWGVYNKTPHAVTLAWMKDCLHNWQKADIGWALWNFRGPFGILDSGRKDVHYQNYRGHQLDAEMLKLLQRY